MSIIQISDMHFPNVEPATADWKDKGFPMHLGEAIFAHPSQSVLRELLMVVEARRDSVAALLVCGDLTSMGDIVGYEKCLEYLDNALQLGKADLWGPDKVHAVPGNHDVNREKCGGSDLLSKFDPLITAWDHIGGLILTAREVRHSQLSVNGCSAELFSLNSCVGCGEKRYIPEKVRNALHELISSGPGADLQWEQLDTPAFLEYDLDTVSRTITALQGRSVAIVLAHHNLLPQVLPRIDIYAEAVNAGLARSMLSRCPQPVVYCHGHIHKDPVEIITNPKAKRGKLVTVASPQFSDGFNIIEVYYSRSSVPIGCQIVPYRLRDGSIEQDDCVRVPLREAADARFIMDEELVRRVLSVITKRPVRFEDIRKELDGEPYRKTLAHILQELEWLGYIEIQNFEEEIIHWLAQRVEP